MSTAAPTAYCWYEFECVWYMYIHEYTCFYMYEDTRWFPKFAKLVHNSSNSDLRVDISNLFMELWTNKHDQSRHHIQSMYIYIFIYIYIYTYVYIEYNPFRVMIIPLILPDITNNLSTATTYHPWFDDSQTS